MISYPSYMLVVINAQTKTATNFSHLELRAIIDQQIWLMFVEVLCCELWGVNSNTEQYKYPI